MKTYPLKFIPVLLSVVASLCFSGAALSQTFTADFSRWSGSPLVKTKFGVYQTPLIPLKTALDSMPLLKEAGVQDFRYEMGWGKPDTHAYDQITRSAGNPIINFAPVDTLANGLRAAGVSPLFAMTYNPLPLKSGDGWQRWKDIPSDLAAWGRINQSYAAHFHAMTGLNPLSYEVWNEPDLPGDGGKVFFNGEPSDYARVYAPAQTGLTKGDSDAQVGGPGIAYNTEFVRAALAYPMDFVSIHAYKNYADQIHAVRPLLNSRPEIPIIVTEYASYKEFGKNAPISRAEAAPNFFSDVRGMLAMADTPKVYWAQWVDNDLGMLTSDLHRKALFNALKIYQTQLPVDRNLVSPDAAGGVQAMAASDDHCAAIIVWNETDTPRPVTLHFSHLPFTHGSISMSRIDAMHGSYGDNPLTEQLSSEQVGKVTTHEAEWSGSLAGNGVLLLRAIDGMPTSLLAPNSIGRTVRMHWWFPDRSAHSYADYDARTSIARLGMGTKAEGTARIGVVMDNPSPRLHMQVRKQGTFARLNSNSLFGVCVDYRTSAGWVRSCLWHDGSYNPKRTSSLSWGKVDAKTVQAIVVPALKEANAFVTLDIKGHAPAGWDGRIQLTPILQNCGPYSSVRLIFRPAN